jgi:hypothetical protein
MVSRHPPDWGLIREIVRVVSADPCGGIHRAELAERFSLAAYGSCMKDALGVAWRHRKIDFCGQYIVKPGEKL